METSGKMQKNIDDVLKILCFFEHMTLFLVKALFSEIQVGFINILAAPPPKLWSESRYAFPAPSIHVPVVKAPGYLSVSCQVSCF